MRPLRSELPVLFGEIDLRKLSTAEAWPNEIKHMIAIDVPTPLQARTGRKRIYCNRAIAVPLRQALDNVVLRGIVLELKTIDGCFNIRKQRGDLLRLSFHSWGMAIDINAAENVLGTYGNLSGSLVACFTDAGFVWGGEWKHRPDPMHFQYVTED